MRNSLGFVSILVAGVFISACAGRVSGALATAPDWYKDRRTEIIGDGYPEVVDVPRAEPLGADDGGLRIEWEELTQAERAFFDNPRSEAPAVSAEELIAWRDEALAEFEPVKTPPDLLSMSEIEAMRALFDPYTTGG